MTIWTRVRNQALRAFLIPLIALITLLSAIILIVSTALVWEPIYDLALPEGGKLKPESREDAKEISRAYWTGKSYSDINKGFHFVRMRDKEVAHFEDVRALIHFLFIPLGVGLITLAIWKWGLKKRIPWFWSLIYMSFFGAIMAIWGVLAWRHMFQTLHWWIFQDDSWILPKGCYSLHLFPYAVWQTVGTVVLGSLFLLLTGLSILQIVPRKHNKGADQQQPHAS